MREIKYPKMSEAAKKKWADPEYRAKQAASALTRPKTGGTTTELQRARWADPETRGRYEAGIRKAAADPEWRERVAHGAVATWKDPEIRRRRQEAMSAAALRRWARYREDNNR